MKDLSKINYPELDKKEVTEAVFWPRPDLFAEGEEDKEIMIPVGDEVKIGAKFHIYGPRAANILFFHGNGEIVSDFDQLGSVFNQMGVNFLPVDYRGYGKSTGSPTVTEMMRDAHRIFSFVQNWLIKNNYNGPFLVMGRSLGSASALELASSYQQDLQGLIIESGFAYISPLLKLLGLDPDQIGFQEESGPGNLDKISKITQPTLIIHAEQDHIIPYSEAKILYENCPANEKNLLTIAHANHNDIFAWGLKNYLQAIAELLKKV